MKHAALILLFATSACGGSVPDPLAPRARRDGIINGNLSGVDDHPATGALLFITEDFGDVFGDFVCTATLIAPDALLLAAHCFRPIPGEEHFFFTRALDVSDFGVGGVDLPENSVPVGGFVTHPEFDAVALDSDPAPGIGDFHDIALAFLDEPVNAVDPAVVMRATDASVLAVGAAVTIAGYGLRTTDPLDASLGIKVHATSVINELGAAEMQIGATAPTPQKCVGDSGGPTLMEFDDGLEPAQRLIGVTSHTYDELGCERGGVDTRVDVHWTWLDQEMQLACDADLRIFCDDGGGLAGPTEPPTDPPDPPGDGCGATDTPPLGALGLLGLRVARRRRRLLGATDQHQDRGQDH